MGPEFDKIAVKVVGPKGSIFGTVIERGLMGSPVVVKDDDTGQLYRKSEAGVFEPIDRSENFSSVRRK